MKNNYPASLSCFSFFSFAVTVTTPRGLQRLRTEQ